MLRTESGLGKRETGEPAPETAIRRRNSAVFSGRALGKCLQKCFEAKGGRLSFRDFFQQHYKKADLPEDQSNVVLFYPLKRTPLVATRV